MILLTGRGDHETDIAAMQAGAAEYLTKGQIDGPLLERAIRHAITAADVDRSARLIWRRSPACLAAGRIETVEGWLADFTRQQVVSQAKTSDSAW